MFKLFRILFAVLNGLSPRLGGRVAVWMFYGPRRFDAARWERAGLATGRQDHYLFDGETLDATVWDGRGPTVLLVHGWEGRRGQLVKMVPPLVAQGFRVVAVDGPAHGSSRKRRTTLVEYAEAVAAATGRFGPVHAIIGHSFGAAASAIAIRRGLVVARLVLISCPYSLRHVVSGFARFAGVPSPSHEAMYPLMAALHRCPEQELSFEAIGPDLSVPTLIVHDEQDRYIPHTDGLKVHGLITRSEITVTSKLGHMRILQDDTVVTRATAFVAHVPGQAIGA